MSLLGNIIWLIFGGLIIGVFYMLAGLLLCLTIIGIPFGIQAINLGLATLAPFGKSVREKPTGDGCLALGFNILWLILFGWEIALAHVISGVLLGITIIGLPLARQHLKLVPVALMPFTYRLE